MRAMPAILLLLVGAPAAAAAEPPPPEITWDPELAHESGRESGTAFDRLAGQARRRRQPPPFPALRAPGRGGRTGPHNRPAFRWFRRAGAFLNIPVLV